MKILKQGLPRRRSDRIGKIIQMVAGKTVNGAETVPMCNDGRISAKIAIEAVGSCQAHLALHRESSMSEYVSLQGLSAFDSTSETIDDYRDKFSAVRGFLAAVKASGLESNHPVIASQAR